MTSFHQTGGVALDPSEAFQDTLAQHTLGVTPPQVQLQLVFSLGGGAHIQWVASKVATLITTVPSLLSQYVRGGGLGERQEARSLEEQVSVLPSIFTPPCSISVSHQEVPVQCPVLSTVERVHDGVLYSAEHYDSILLRTLLVRERIDQPTRKSGSVKAASRSAFEVCRASSPSSRWIGSSSLQNFFAFRQLLCFSFLLLFLGFRTCERSNTRKHRLKVPTFARSSTTCVQCVMHCVNASTFPLRS